MPLSSVSVMPAQVSAASFGRLQLAVTGRNDYNPIENASIQITGTGSPDTIIEKLTTDNSGETPAIELPAPPVSYSMESGSEQPYSEYNFTIQAEGYSSLTISGAQILADVTALQNVRLTPSGNTEASPIVVPPHTLYGNFPPKIAEAEIKDVTESGEVVLSRVVIPETIIVHDGPPTDSRAANYYIPFKEYIKNVASSEIYATWPESSIIANCLAIISFTLNRVFTEWYRNKGYDFTITNSTAYDHFFVYGRNIFENISETVDMIFSNYLSRPGVLQPILTQYCDGRRVSCPNWMSQWGSKDLGEQGYSPIEILRYYYGDDIYINSAEQISGIPSSWPGYDLTIGSSGQKVQQMQEQLNRISDNYPAIPKIAADGIYGSQTAEAVRIFQRIFNLPQTGVTDYATWYKISQIYVGVSRIAELN